MKKSKDFLANKYKKLDDVDHVLLRPGRYIGSTSFHKRESYLFDEDSQKFELYDITFNPGFLKLFDEIISNSVDEFKNKDSLLNTIKVTINTTENFISIWDNGGIPVEIHPVENIYIPEMLFSELKAGSNFNDVDDRTGAGLHGEGATLTNIFSKKFIVKTADGEKSFEQEFTENMRKRSNPIIKTTTKHYTEIIYYPDLDKFGMLKIGIDEISKDIITKRLIDIAACNPNLKIYLNEKLLKYSDFHKYTELYVPHVFYEKSKDWQIGLGLSKDGYRHVSFVNSVETKEGGTHVDYIINQIINWLRDKIQKKYKIDVKPSELKQYMFLFVNATVINSSFGSQTKEKLITAQIDFGTEHIVSDTFMKAVFESDIVKNVLDWLEKKKSAEERRELRKLNKNLSSTKVEKLIDAKAKGQRNHCILGIFEGLCLEENTFVKVLRDSFLEDIKIKDLKITDTVITHKNRLRDVNQISKRIEKVKQIKIKGVGIIEPTEKHAFYLYDKRNNLFDWVQVKDINIEYHQFVKNKLIYLKSLDEILDIIEINDKKFKYKIILKNDELLITVNTKLAIFNIITNEIKMLDITEINKDIMFFVNVLHI